MVLNASSLDVFLTLLRLLGCWIVTGGFQLGIMKLAGEAVRDYTDAYGGNRMLAFGVSSWGCVKKNDILEAALEEVSRISFHFC